MCNVKAQLDIHKQAKMLENDKSDLPQEFYCCVNFNLKHRYALKRHGKYTYGSHVMVSKDFAGAGTYTLKKNVVNTIDKKCLHLLFILI